MKAFIWKLRCALHYMRRAKLGAATAWDIAGIPSAEDRAEYGPEEYADEEMSCWSD